MAVETGSSCTVQEKNNTSSSKKLSSDIKSVRREEEIKKSQNVGICGKQVSETSGKTKKLTTTLSNKNGTIGKADSRSNSGSCSHYKEAELLESPESPTPEMQEKFSFPMEKADSRSNSRSGLHCEEAELPETPESHTPDIQEKFSFSTSGSKASTNLVTKLASHSNPPPPVVAQTYPVAEQTFTGSRRTNTAQTYSPSGHTRQTAPLVQPVPQPVLLNGTRGIPAAVYRMPQRVSRFDVAGTQPMLVTRPSISNVAVVQPMHSQVPALQTGSSVVQPMTSNVGIPQSSPSFPGPINLQPVMGNVPMRPPVQSNVIPTQSMPAPPTVIMGPPMAAVAQSVSTNTAVTKPSAGVSFANTASVNKSSTASKPLNNADADSAESGGNTEQPGCPMTKKILEYCHDVAQKPQSAENNANAGKNSMQSAANDAPSRPADNRSLSGTALEPQLSRNQQYKISAEDPQLSQHYVEWVQLLIDDNRVSH